MSDGLGGRADVGSVLPADRLSRRQVLSAMAFVLGGAAMTGCADRSSRAVPPAGSIRGADLSFTLQLEAAGRTYTDRGDTAPVEQLLAARGANTVRLRAWVDPPRDYSDMTSALSLARRAHEAGCGVLLDLHYSDFWADKRHQITPAAWIGQDLSTLAATVRRYTRDAVRAFAAQGTPLSMIQIGNEVTNGMLWPLGQIYRDGRENWDGFATLIEAGLTGAREGATAPLQTMIHIERSGDNTGARYFFDRIAASGIEFDLVGLSYYPFWHGSLGVLSANLNDLADRYGKGIVIVETAYPWVFPAGDGVDYYAARPDQLPEHERFPATPDGQAAYFEALRATVEGVPDGRGAGFVVWEPAWGPGVGWDHGQDNPYANLTMFDADGQGLSSLAVFRP